MKPWDNRLPNYPPRLPTSTVRAALDWGDSPEFWAALVPHVGELSSVHQGELASIIQRYVGAAELEREAPEVSKARIRLREIKAAVEAFRRILDSHVAEVGLEADLYVEGLLNDYLEARSGTDVPPRVTHYSHAIAALYDACLHAETRLKTVPKRKPFQPGTAWRTALIEPLAEFWEVVLGREPIRIRKDADKRSEVGPDPPFVAFTLAVESCLPELVRPAPRNSPQANRDAVAAAVSNWRRRATRGRTTPRKAGR